MIEIYGGIFVCIGKLRVQMKILMKREKLLPLWGNA